MVAEEGFEPPTHGLWFHCSNQLSYSALTLKISQKNTPSRKLVDSKRLAYLGLESPSVFKKDPFVCPLRRPKKHQMGGTCQSFYRLCHIGDEEISCTLPKDNGLERWQC